MKVIETVFRDGLFGSDWLRMTYWDGDSVECSIHGAYWRWELEDGRCSRCGKEVVPILKVAYVPYGCLLVIGERNEDGEKACEQGIGSV